MDLKIAAGVDDGLAEGIWVFLDILLKLPFAKKSPPNKKIIKIIQIGANPAWKLLFLECLDGSIYDIFQVVPKTCISSA